MYICKKLLINYRLFVNLRHVFCKVSRNFVCDFVENIRNLVFAVENVIADGIQPGFSRLLAVLTPA